MYLLYMECKRCGNTDPSYFYNGSKGIYCRKCVRFKRILLDEEQEELLYDIDSNTSDYELSFELTKYQKEASNDICRYIENGYDVLLNSVCGAGKTELVVECIKSYIERGLKVCYAISRKEVVIELTNRYRSIFNKAKVCSVYGGHHDELTGDFIVCTTHQLFRYYKTFDLLILDEVDAFPLNNNEPLMNIAINSCKGRIIYSTATLNTFILKYIKKREYREVNLYVRPSLKPLIVPRIKYMPNLMSYLYLYKILKNSDKQWLVFVSSKKKSEWLYLIFKKLLNATYVYSDLDKRRKNINDYKTKKKQIIFTTTVLERGITIKDVNVVILYDRKGAFSKESLIQMCGRVGRNIDNPYGDLYIITSSLDKNVIRCKKEIEGDNKQYEMQVM